MAIKTTTFGRVELSGKDADRFIQHMDDDKPNQKALDAINHGRKIVEKIERGESLTFSTSNG